MMKLNLITCITCLVLINATTFAQVLVNRDSAGNSLDTLRISPDRQKTNDVPGAYSYVLKDPIALQIFAGQNVVNTLQGHVPNLAFSTSAGNGSNGIRYNSPMLLVDGVSYGEQIWSYSNLTTFEFASISAVSSGNPFTLYGGVGAHGGVVLESRNGRGFAKPSFEINNSTSYIHIPETRETLWNSPKVDRWRFSNSAAYSQDFGAFDLRVSYSNIYNPPVPGDFIESSSAANTAKVNAGFEKNRFSARLIVEGRQVHGESEDDDGNSLANQKVPAFSYNLFLSHKVSDWLTLSSQGLINKFKGEYEQSGSAYESDQESKEGRAFINVMATAQPRMEGIVKLKFATGGQIERQTLEYDYISRSGDNYFGGSVDGIGKQRAWITYANLSLGDMLTAQFNHRLDYFIGMRDGEKDQHSYSAGLNLDLVRAFHAQSPGFSSAVIRGTVGRTSALEYGTFPFPQNSFGGLGGNFFFPYRLANPSLKPTYRRTVEVGADLAFLQSRMLFNATYYNMFNNQTIVEMSPPWGGFPTYADIGTVRMEGLEFVLGGVPLQKVNTTLLTKVIYGRYHSFIPDNGENMWGGLRLDSQLPDWTGSILNEFRLKHAFLRLIVSYQNGDEYAINDGWGTPLGRVSVTRTWLRDLSVGYEFSRVTASLSAWNLWLISGDRSYDGFFSRSETALTASVTVRL